MKLFGEIIKVEPQDDGAIKVVGVASTGATDEADERVLPEAMKAALPAYMRFGALREMHGLSAAGATLSAEVGEDGATRIEALVVDPVAVKKVQLGVYNDVAVELAISSTTLAAGAALYLYVFDKYQIDGSTSYYGDNALTGTGGTQKAYLPSYGLVGAIAPTLIGAAQTLVLGVFRTILLPPRSFRFALGNSLGVTLASSGHFVSLVTFNLNLNN